MDLGTLRNSLDSVLNISSPTGACKAKEANLAKFSVTTWLIGNRGGAELSCWANCSWLSFRPFHGIISEKRPRSLHCTGRPRRPLLSYCLCIETLSISCTSSQSELSFQPTQKLIMEFQVNKRPSLLSIEERLPSTQSSSQDGVWPLKARKAKKNLIWKTCRFRRYTKKVGTFRNYFSLASFVMLHVQTFFVAFLHTRFPLAVSIKGCYCVVFRSPPALPLLFLLLKMVKGKESSGGANKIKSGPRFRLVYPSKTEFAQRWKNQS